MIECPKLYLVKQGQSIFKITQKILNNTANEFEINIFYDYMSKITKISAKKLIKKYFESNSILLHIFAMLYEELNIHFNNNVKYSLAEEIRLYLDLNYQYQMANYF